MCRSFWLRDGTPAVLGIRSITHVVIMIVLCPKIILCAWPRTVEEEEIINEKKKNIIYRNVEVPRDKSVYEKSIPRTHAFIRCCLKYLNRTRIGVYIDFGVYTNM